MVSHTIYRRQFFFIYRACRVACEMLIAGKTQPDCDGAEAIKKNDAGELTVNSPRFTAEQKEIHVKKRICKGCFQEKDMKYSGQEPVGELSFVANN